MSDSAPTRANEEPTGSTTPPTASAVVIAHGSRNERANSDHLRLCEAIAEQLGTPVFPAFLELAEPAIGTAIDAAVAQSQTVRVLPLFVHHGNHVGSDIPALVEQARQRHSGARIELTEHIGADPGFTELIVGILAR